MVPLISIAPMLSVTDNNYRYFMRQITSNVRLYSEMVVADAIIHGDLERYGSIDNSKTAIQLAGNCETKLALASKICKNLSFDEINLNVGCPSVKVSSGDFGACLMLSPNKVRDILRCMQNEVDIPVTVKHRIGINNNNDYEFLYNFVNIVRDSGCKTFIVHARNALLTGISPKKNLQIPPLKYDYVYQLKKAFPDLIIIINGGIKTIEDIKTHLQYVDGVMIGREAYYNPFIFSEIETKIFNMPALTRIDIAYKMLNYLNKLEANNLSIKSALRAIMHLFAFCEGAKKWRQQLSTCVKTVRDYHCLLECMEKYHEF